MSRQPGVSIARAGVPAKQDPPKGMNFIASQAKLDTLRGKPAGFTGIKSAAAFTQPSFTTKLDVEKDGYKRRYFAIVEPTTAGDVTHPSFYPGAGVHENAISKQKEATYEYFWSISERVSSLIRAGEQEHLNDAQRAFDLTYGLIAREINAMAGQRFGPAESPQAASKMAEDELRRRLPAALGTDPVRWFNVLDQMLDMTLKRDRDHLHDVLPGEAKQKATSFYIPLQETPDTKVDQVSSELIVTYPSDGNAKTSGASSSEASKSDNDGEKEHRH